MNAKDKSKTHIAQIKALLKSINNGSRDCYSYHKSNPGNWAITGTLAHVVAELQAVNAFINGGK